MRQRRSISFIFMVIVGALMALHFGISDGTAKVEKGLFRGTIHWGIAAKWFDPSVTDLRAPGYFPLYMIHDALLKPMEGDMYAPCLAESWTWNDDYTQFEFKLRKGVKFQNGDEMTAEDVVFTFQRYRGGNAKLLKSRIDKLEAVNPYLFRITFKEPFLDFIDYLVPGFSTIAWIVPKKYIEKVGDEEYLKHPIGCGPYKFVEFRPGVKVVAEAFDQFWRKKPKVKRMEWLIVPEKSTRYAMVKKGEVDLATLMTDVYYKKVQEDPNLRMVPGISTSIFTVILQNQWNPDSPWSDVRVRKAASLAIDRQSVADIHAPGVGPAGSFGLPYDPNTLPRDPDPYDPGQAKKLLAEAGYPDGFTAGIYYPYPGGYQEMSLQIANYWRAVGIEVKEVRMLDKQILLAKRRAGELAGTMFVDSNSFPTVASRLSYQLKPPAGFCKYEDINALYEKYLDSVDLKERKDLLMEIQQLIYDKYMFIPVVQSVCPTALGPRVKGDPLPIRKPYPVWFVAPMEDLELNE